MAVRITESRIPGGFANAGKLGEAVYSADGNYVLVSYLTAPLRADPTLLKLRNRYVIFVNIAGGATEPANYEWILEFFGADSPTTPVHTTQPRITDIGVYSLDAEEIPEIYDVQITRVIVKVTMDGVAEPLVMDQAVTGLFTDIEELIASDTSGSIARGGHPPTTRAIANRYRSYIMASESEDPSTGVPPNLIAAITYLKAMESTDDVRALQEEAWENYINGAGDETTIPQFALGVTQLFPYIVSMFVDGEGGFPGVTAPEVWATDYEAYSVFRSRVSQAFHLVIPRPFAPTERCDYINLLRFPKSALRVTRVLLDTRLAQHPEWANLPRTELLENREAIKVLTSECEVGPFAGNPELTTVGSEAFDKMFTPFIRGMVRITLYDIIGNYEIRDDSGNAVTQFPLYPGTSFSQAVPNRTAGTNFGLVDVALAIPKGAPLIRTSTPNTGLTTEPVVAGVNSAPIFAEAGLDVAQLTFLLDVGHATNPFKGTLHLEVQTSDGRRDVDIPLDIPLEVRPHESENSLFIPLSLVQQLCECTWIQLQASSAVGGTAVEGATAKIQFLRDNNRIRDYNRHFSARTVVGGLLSGNVEGVVSPRPRTTIGVPINWPLLFDVRAANFVNHVKMLKLSTAERTGHHNNNPHMPSTISMQPTGTRSLAGRRIVIDPGHGVAYKAVTSKRRCYEWFLAHRIGARVHTLLTDEHGVAEEDIIHMRTAGLALINPSLFATRGTTLSQAISDDKPPANAPELGDKDYEYDMTARKVRIKKNALTLTHISDLLLTEHDDEPPFAAQKVSDEDRKVILTENADMIAARIADIMEGVAGRTAVSGSARWNTQTQRYVFDSVPADNPEGERRTHNITIGTTDQWVVSKKSLRRLAERTARWSLLREGLGNSDFSNVVRTAMLSQNALNYMVQAILCEVDRAVPDVFLNHGIKGWSFGRRRSVMRLLVPAPDIILTLHHNALTVDGGTARGLLMLASNTESATAAHMRLQKTFIKYITGLGGGLSVWEGQRGITNTHESALNGDEYAALIPGFAFFENEYMNVGSDDPSLQFEYERLVRDDYIDRTAQEIVAGIVDFLVNPQPNTEFDPIFINKNNKKINVNGVLW